MFRGMRGEHMDKSKHELILTPHEGEKSKRSR